MKEKALRGIYRIGAYYYFRLPMVRGLRPKPISLQTKDLEEALSRATAIRKTPTLATPLGGMKGEIERLIATGLAAEDYTASTAKSKRYSLVQFADWLPRGTQPASVTTAQIQEYYNLVLKNRSVATAHKAFTNISSLFRWELKMKRVRSNPCEGVVVKTPPGTARPLFCTMKQRDKLINECPREDLKFVLMVGFHAGLRKNEIIQAVPGWFHLDRRTVDLTSTPTMRFNLFKKARTIPMDAALFAFLSSYGLREPFMLRPEVEQGKDIYRYDFDVALQYYVKAQKMEWVTAHVMRHTFASLLVQANKNIYKVAEWMGDTVKTVQRHYGHLAGYDSDIELAEPTKKPARGKQRK